MAQATARPGLVAGAALLLLGLLPLADRLLPPGWGVAATLPDILVFAVVGLGLNVLTGWAGQLNLGVGAWMAVGAYGYAILTSPVYPFGLGFWGGLAAAVALGGATGVVLGLPTMRLSGDYLALVTLGFGEIVGDLLLNLEPITKGNQGINPVPAPWLPGLPAGHALATYYLYLGLTAMAALACRNLLRSPLGRAWTAVREDELAARALGIDAARAKLSAAAVCGACAALGGALFAALQGSSVNPGKYDFQVSVMVLCAVLAGGLGSIPGVLLGTLLAFGLNTLVLDRLGAMARAGSDHPLAQPANWKYLVYGLALILVMRFRPQGLIPRARRTPAAHAGRVPVAPPPPPERPADGCAPLAVESLSVRFGGLTALDRVSFALRPGEILAVIGPNGAGKSTLFNAISGLVAPAGGRVLVSGRTLEPPLDAAELRRWALAALALAGAAALAWRALPLWQAAVLDLHRWQQPFPWGRALAAAWDALWSGWEVAAVALAGAALGFAGGWALWRRARRAPERTARAGIGRTFQNNRLFRDASALDNVLAGMDPRRSCGRMAALLRLPAFRRAEAAATERAHALLEQVGLGGLAGRTAGSLPWGHQRRLEIARALAGDPTLLLLDEPAAGMNPSESRELMELIRALRDRGLTILLIEHDMQVVMGVSDRVVVLDYGAVIAEGPPGAVRQDSNVIAAYLGKEP
jgi:branched-chain amino acid transport system permease protein